MGDLRWGKPLTGAGTKPGDHYVLPMSPEWHRRQHAMGEAHFWGLLKIDPIPIAVALWLYTGDEATCRTILALNRPSPTCLL